jgi:hypothetical protein
MNEKLLQFIWDNCFFETAGLCTVDGEVLEILSTGTWNKHQGPDFLSGHVMIHGVEWIGNIEMHMLSTDWELHGHGHDPNYNNVVLHVVWKHNKKIKSAIPILELHDRVPEHMIQRYKSWMLSASVIPCSADLPGVSRSALNPFLDRLTIERFRDRAQQVHQVVTAAGMDWQEAFWHALAKGFGYKVNAEAFERIAATIPYRILLKHRSSVEQLEALLMGQAGLLRADTADGYAKLLYREYVFLQKKYGLQKSYMPVHFLRMRPGNFPTVRFAQLAMLIHQEPNLFRAIKDGPALGPIREILSTGTSEYWEQHYRFNELSVKCKKVTGQQFIDNLITNVIIPFLIAYQHHTGNSDESDRYMNWLALIPPESNAILLEFSRGGLKAEHRGASQALLELHKHYCSQLNCLQCAVGKLLLEEGSEYAHMKVAGQISMNRKSEQC